MLYLMYPPLFSHGRHTNPLLGEHVLASPPSSIEIKKNFDCNKLNLIIMTFSFKPLSHPMDQNKLLLEKTKTELDLLLAEKFIHWTHHTIYTKANKPDSFFISLSPKHWLNSQSGLNFQRKHSQVTVKILSEIQTQLSQLCKAKPDFTTDQADTISHDLVMPKFSDKHHKTLMRTVSVKEVL